MRESDKEREREREREREGHKNSLSIKNNSRVITAHFIYNLVIRNSF